MGLLIHPVVLSGGSGTRLWPLSRELYPKQMHALAGERTLLQQTVLRTVDSPLFAPPLLIANDEHRFVVAEQLRQIGVEPLAIILEPIGRNTAPAAAIAALALAQNDPESLLLLMPSDHIIADQPAFLRAVATAMGGVLLGFHLAALRLDPLQIGAVVLQDLPPSRDAATRCGVGALERRAAHGVLRCVNRQILIVIGITIINIHNNNNITQIFNHNFTSNIKNNTLLYTN